MSEQEKIQLFENQRIRTAWDSEREEWYFSIVDVVGVLVEAEDFDTSRKYWNKVKQRMVEEGNYQKTVKSMLPMLRPPKNSFVSSSQFLPRKRNQSNFG